jgi:hypothetical protein
LVPLDRPARKIHHADESIGVRGEDAVESDYMVVMWMGENDRIGFDATRSKKLDGWYERGVTLGNPERINDQPRLARAANEDGFTEARPERNEMNEIRIDRRR